MAQHGRSLATELRLITNSVRTGDKSMAALFAAVALAVLREGSETVLFVAGFATTETAQNLALGVVLGIVSGAALGALLYAGLVRIPARHFFRVTGWMIVALAAGLAAQAARFLEQANLLPPLVSPMWDSSMLLTEESLPGKMLHVLVGYTARPSAMQIVFWIATLAVLVVAGRHIQRMHFPAKPQSTAA
jgi:high-affinity iron transporter